MSDRLPRPAPKAARPPVLALRRSAPVRAGPRRLRGAPRLSVLLDVGCLAGSLAAVWVNIPWTLLPLADSAAQLLALLPLTPGRSGFWRAVSGRC